MSNPSPSTAGAPQAVGQSLGQSAPIGRRVLGARLAVMLATLWWGMVSGLAFVAVPLLFAKLGSPAVAGPVAAALFGVVARLSMVAGALLTAYLMFLSASPLDRWMKFAIVFVVLAVVASACQETLVAQRILTARATGGDLRLWHGVGTLAVLTQWWGALVASWVLLRRVGETPAHCPT